MDYFSRFFRSELTKSLYQKKVYIVLLLPFLLVIHTAISWIGLTNDQFRNQYQGPGIEESPWYYYYRQTFLIIPALYIIISAGLAYMSIDIEHRRRMWKYIFTIPKAEKYLIPAKQLSLLIWLLLSLTATYLFTIGIGYLVLQFSPDIAFKTHDVFWDLLALVYLKMYLFLIPIILLHTYISLFFRLNILLPILAPCFMWLIETDWLPHNIPFYRIFKIFFYNGFNLIGFRESFVFFDKYVILSLIYTFVLILIGQFTIRKNIYKILN